jgi:hypothetical protein
MRSNLASLRSDRTFAAAEKVNSINKSQNTTLDPITVTKSFPIFNKSIDCDTIKAELAMSVDATLNAKIAFGYVISVEFQYYPRQFSC